MKKRIFYTEFAYLFGVIVLAFGTALMEKADFGMSMVVAPAYILHLKISQFLPFFSFGMAEYSLQAVIILLMVLILRKFNISYLFSFITAVFYGFTLDFFMILAANLPADNIYLRLIYYVVGMAIGAISISALFHTYISPEAYELFVKEVSSKFRININVFKTIYDCISLVLSIILSFVFFGLWHFEGVKLGTLFCAFLNGYLISLATKFFNRYFVFEDKFALRKYFE